MTRREYFEAVLNAHINDEMDEASAGYIAKLDATNAARKGKVSKKSQEHQEWAQAVILPMLGDEPQSATDIAAQVEGLSIQKASAALRYLVKADFAEAADVIVPKKGVRKVYIKK